MLKIIGKGYASIRIKKLERLARRVKDPSRLQLGSMIIYTPESRPNVVCPHCQVSSATLGEAEALEWFRGRVGIVTVVDDPRGMDKEFMCNACGKPSPPPNHFKAMCIMIQFKHQRLGEPGGVWAYPSELRIVGRDAWKAAKMPELKGATT
ncbi:hypothetical protein LCGC14_2348350 [marine sediment metagenome]|uniref:Uncharacterized protein n=1 Tax=marine sediment metagenome TaxID=412755 RepID=A0A0F9CAP1_9ZZZZ